MTNRLNIGVNTETYKKLNEFIQNHKLITTPLTKGTVVTIALNLLYETIKEKDIETLMTEYLNKDGE